MKSTSLTTVLNVDEGESGPSLPEWHSSQIFFNMHMVAGPPVATRVSSPSLPTGRCQFSLFYFAKMWSAKKQRARKKEVSFSVHSFKRLPASNLIQWFICCSCHLSKVLWTHRVYVCISEGFSSPWELVSYFHFHFCSNWVFENKSLMSYFHYADITMAKYEMWWKKVLKYMNPLPIPWKVIDW